MRNGETPAGQAQNGFVVSRHMADPEYIPAWQRLGPQVTTSGYLTDGDVTALDALGVRHVINLALGDHPQALSDEAGKLAAHGIAYTHIPVPFGAPGEEHFRAFCGALQSAARPVHVHCIANWRVSAFFYRFAREAEGMPEPEAHRRMSRQWDPAVHPHPDAPVWAAFIGVERQPEA